MMAMRPPTSPTTVMGGFSFGINTGNRNKKRETVRIAVFQLILLRGNIETLLSGCVLLFAVQKSGWASVYLPKHSILCYMVVTGFLLARVLALHGISMLGWMAPVVLTVGGECRPSTWSDSASWASPWITAIPRRSRSANDWALHTHTERTLQMLQLVITTHCTSSESLKG